MEVSMEEICCTKCNMSFWITCEAWKNFARFANHIFCPNGHEMWINNLEEKLFTSAIQRDEEIRELKNRNNSLYRSNAALRGVITRMRNKHG